MEIYTDNTDYATRIFGSDLSLQTATLHELDERVRRVADMLVRTDRGFRRAHMSQRCWEFLLMIEEAPRSQYDVLIHLVQKGVPLPDRLLCLAGAGSQLHGFKGRPWVALPGNIHLCVYLTPRRKIRNFGAGFTVLSAVSVQEAIDRVPDLTGRVSLKWVNDILVDEAKVGGVLAHTQSQGEIVTAVVLGIGVNVETTPRIKRDPFVPVAASLRDFVGDPSRCTEGQVLGLLLDRLADNYEILVQDGYDELLNRYRQRSAILGQRVTVYPDAAEYSDRPLASGTVVAIGENLELYLEGQPEPIRHGRLVLNDSPALDSRGEVS